MEEEPGEGFIDDVERRDNQEPGFEEGREVFKFAVAVGMALVGGLIGDADGEKGDDGGDEVEAGMECFGENAEAAGAPNEEGLETQEDSGGPYAEESSAPFFRFGGMEARGEDHDGIRLPVIREL